MRKKRILLLSIFVLLFVICALWVGGIIPKQIAKRSAEQYLEKNFPKAELKFVDIEWSSAFGGYSIQFENEDHKKFSFIMNHRLLPINLGQGLFEFTEYYRQKYGSSSISDSVDFADTSVSWVNYDGSGEIYSQCLNVPKLAISSVKHLPIYKFESLAELNAFKEAFKDTFAMNATYDEVSSFEDNTKKMDENYFAEKTVFLVYVTAGSGSYRFGVDSISKDADNFCVHIKQTNDPEVGTCDMAGWFIIVAVDKSAVQNITNFDADFIHPEN